MALVWLESSLKKLVTSTCLNDPKIFKEPPHVMGNICIKYHDCRIERRWSNHAEMAKILKPKLNLDHKINGGHPQYMGNICMKYQDCRLKDNEVIIMQKWDVMM